MDGKIQWSQAQLSHPCLPSNSPSAGSMYTSGAEVVGVTPASRQQTRVVHARSCTVAYMMVLSEYLPWRLIYAAVNLPGYDDVAFGHALEQMIGGAGGPCTGYL